MGNKGLVVSTCFQFSRLPEDITEWLDFRFYPSFPAQGFNSAKLAKATEGANVAIVGDDTADREFFAKSSSLELLVRWGSGTDNVDFSAAQEFGVNVVNTPGLFGEDVSDLAISMAISLVRNVPKASTAVFRGEWPKETTKSFREMKVSVVGYGAVGRELCRLLGIFGVPVRVYDPFARDFDSGIASAPSLAECLRGSNVLFLCSPLSPETKNAFGRELILSLERPRYLVNVARGELLNEEEIISSLLTGDIDGLGLDVFSDEPTTLDLEALSGLNVILSSHNASNTNHSIALANSRVNEILREYVEANSQESEQH